MYAHALQSSLPIGVTVRAGGTLAEAKAERLPETHRITQPFVVFGRARQCDVQLPDRTVSLRHLLVHSFRDRLFAVDLFSANGSRADGKKLASGWIGGRTVEVGPFEIEATQPAREVPLSEEPASPLEFKPRKDQSDFYGELPRVRLEVTNVKSKGDPPSWPINRILTLLGRSDRCRITCGDDSISSVHAALVLTPSGLWVSDLITRTGIRINGEPVRVGLLSEGHELEVGHYKLKAVYEDRPHPLPTATPAGADDNVAFVTKNHRVFRTDPAPPVLVVKPQGDLQQFRYQEVQLEANAIIAALARPGYPHAVIDFSEVKLVGSVMLESIAGICRAAKGKAAFCSATPEMYQALVDTNLQTLWYHYNSRDDAVAAVTYPA